MSEREIRIDEAKRALKMASGYGFKGDCNLRIPERIAERIAALENGIQLCQCGKAESDRLHSELESGIFSHKFSLDLTTGR